jgi:hypothetical protein
MVQKYKKKWKSEAILEVLFGFSQNSSYLCSRFPRNRWQEVTSCLLCCVGTIQQNHQIKVLKNGFNQSC